MEVKSYSPDFQFDNDISAIDLSWNRSINYNVLLLLSIQINGCLAQEVIKFDSHSEISILFFFTNFRFDLID